jgi:recombination protein RecR
VEGTKDVNVFEKIGHYYGKYHVLNGLISPLNGVGPDDINIQNILKRVDDEKIEEIIVATSATIEGEMTALYIKNSLENKNIKVYRIGYGLPAGGDIEYADEMTLIKALEGRKEL